MNIIGFIKGVLPSFSKSDIEEDIEISLSEISDLIEAYTRLGDVIKHIKLDAPKAKKIVAEFYKEFNKSKDNITLKLSTDKNIGSDTALLLGVVKMNAETVLAEISEALNDVIVSKALTAYKANLLRSASHLYYITRYGFTLVNYIYVAQAENGDIELDKSYMLNKKQEDLLHKNLWIYARLLAAYATDTKVFTSRVKSLANVVIDTSVADELEANYAHRDLELLDNIPNNFIGSPIYAIRLVFAQWAADRYKAKKDKKRLLELRYLHLKMMQDSGNTDVSVEKEIQYIQKDITDLERDIVKTEESVE